MENDRRILITVVAVSVLLVGVFALLVRGADGTASASRLIGEPAPRLVAGSWKDGEVSLTDYQGQWVVVNFFASWCTGCVEEHPELVAFDEAHRAAGDAVLLGISFGEPKSAAIRYMEQYGGDWPILFDPRGNAAINFAVLTVPETFIISPNGIVVEHITGPTTKAQLDAVIDFYSSPS